MAQNKLLVSGATSPDLNGIYISLGVQPIKNDAVSPAINKMPLFKHVSKNYFIVPYGDDVPYANAIYYMISDLGDWNGTEYFYLENQGTEQQPVGSYVAADGTGNVVVTEYLGGTIGTSSINTNYIDKSYIGDDGNAVAVS